jgi:hypothetical protein
MIEELETENRMLRARNERLERELEEAKQELTRSQKMQDAGFTRRPKGLDSDAEKDQEPVQHWSDCAMHREPAYPKGECDCGGYIPATPATEEDLKVYQSIADNYFKDTQPKRAVSETHKPLTDEQIDDLHGEANRGFCIEREDYFKAFRDAEAAHGITKD